MENIILQLNNIKKNFSGTKVLKGVNLEVKKGEFITFLGSSGCGKTTTLRIIAGLETPDEGVVLLEGKDVTNVEPHKRSVNTVFQNYALFPHMNVFANVAYGMKIRKVPKDEIKRTVSKILNLVQLNGYEERMPSELSGGQKQRVAIARAIVNNPKVLLLDEPLGALDLQLRRQMQIELKKLQKKLGITFIYITHDQEEAINMSDRIVVMKDGVFEQIGTPDEVYNKPMTSFVAKFVGSANILEGKILGQENGVTKVSAYGGEVFVSCEEQISLGTMVTIAVRSESIELNTIGVGLEATISEKSFQAGMMHMVLHLKDGTEIVASRHGINVDYEEGQVVSICWNPENAVFVDRGN